MATRSGSQHPCRRTTDFGSEYSDSERNRHALVGTNDETMIGSEDYKRATKRWNLGLKDLFTVVIAAFVLFRTIFSGNVRTLSKNDERTLQITCDDNSGGWTKVTNVTTSEVCSIEKRFVDQLSSQEFEEKFRYKKPLILRFRNKACDWTNPKLWSKQYLRKYFGQKDVLVGTDMDIVMGGGSGYISQEFTEYLDKMIGGNKNKEPLYLFDRDFLKNTRLLDSLVLPSYLRPTNVEDFESIFIMGTTSSGVSFHKHADGWNGVIFGKKRWFIYPKETTPPGGDWPSFNQQDWLTKVYKHLPPSKLPYECVQEAGEILYVPESFYHATINIGDTVAIAVQRISGQTRAMRLFDKVSNTFFDKNPYSKTSIEKRVNLYNRLADVLPENTEILVKLAETLVLSGYLKRARDLMTKAVSKDEFNARAFVGLARIHAELSAHDDADVAFRRAIEINAESAVVYAEYGLYLVEQGRFEDAKVIYYQASKKWPFEEEFLVGLLKMQEKLGQQELAEITKSILTRVRKINA